MEFIQVKKLTFRKKAVIAISLLLLLIAVYLVVSDFIKSGKGIIPCCEQLSSNPGREIHLKVFRDLKV